MEFIMNNKFFGRIFLSLLSVLTFSSCTTVTVRQIGRVNMISNRNIDPSLNYKLISSYSGGSEDELKDSKAKTIDGAVNQTVRRVPGGEFLMNVNLYVVDEKFYAVEGDVWGYKSEMSYRGFKVGDQVVVDGLFSNSKATIKSLKDNKTCFIEYKDGAVKEVEYDKIFKIE